jgi:hypothetical protein
MSDPVPEKESTLPQEASPAAGPPSGPPADASAARLLPAGFTCADCWRFDSCRRLTLNRLRESRAHCLWSPHLFEPRAAAALRFAEGGGL